MGRGLRGVLAAAGALAAVALFAPAAAVAHPCASANAKAAAASSFLSVNSATWVGMHRPDFDHECGGEGGPVTSTLGQGGGRGRDHRRRPDVRAGRSRVRVHAEHDADRLLGERDPVPARAVQLGPRVQGRLRVHGHQRRLRRDRHQGPGEARSRSTSTRAARPRRATSSSTGTSSCARGTPRPAPPAPRRSPAAARSSARASRASTSSTSPTRRTPSWSTSATTPPTASRACASRPQDVPRKGCGSHTATAVPAPGARRALHLQRRLVAARARGWTS